MQAAVQRLSPEHREVIVLREFEYLSYEEIAAVLEVPGNGSIAEYIGLEKSCTKNLKSVSP